MLEMQQHSHMENQEFSKADMGNTRLGIKNLNLLLLEQEMVF